MTFFILETRLKKSIALNKRIKWVLNPSLNIGLNPKKMNVRFLKQGKEMKQIKN
jgi:hypothetical protein